MRRALGATGCPRVQPSSTGVAADRRGAGGRGGAPPTLGVERALPTRRFLLTVREARRRGQGKPRADGGCEIDLEEINVINSVVPKCLDIERGKGGGA